MVFLEILAVIIIILLIIILVKLSKKQGTVKEDGCTNQVLLKQLEKLEKGDESTSKFLSEKLAKLEKEMDKKAEEDNKRQEKITKCVEDNIATFTRTIHGTSRRGKVGEAILKEMLKGPIESGLIITDLNADSGKVEFAWDLKNGKYLPIDSKMPELEESYKKFEETDDVNEQNKLKKDIFKQIEKRKKEAMKYLNNNNTIDKCIVAIPDAISEMAPDINKDAVKTGVFVSGYTKVFLFACVLSEYYLKSLETGEVGVYRETISALKNILKEIESRSDTINKGITQITNANSKIQIEIGKSMSKISQVSIIEKKESKKIE